MKPLKIKDIVEAVKGRLVRGDPETLISNFSTDTRTLIKGDFFVPIKGDNFDGHDFIGAALSKGAAGFLFEKNSAKKEGVALGAAIEVEDSLKAYGEIAWSYRDSLKKLKVIAVTGSNGKTTTKDMIAFVLEKKFKVLKTLGTLNNFVGLPRTILSIEEDTDIAVLELGMSALGEIERLSRIASPDIGVITNVGHSHIEFLGNIENVARGKAELASGVKKTGVVFLNGDDRFTGEIAEKTKQKVIRFGKGAAADFAALNVAAEEGSLSFDLFRKADGGKVRITAPVTGNHNVYNILAAAAVCAECGMSLEEISESVRNLKLPPMRHEISCFNGIKIINDAYNSNPNSFRAALGTFDMMKSKGKKVLVFGDMLELGGYSETAHSEAGKQIAKSSADVLITVGAAAKITALAAEELSKKNLKIFACDNKDAAVKILAEQLRKDDILMLKGSRGNKLEEIIETYKKLNPKHEIRNSKQIRNPKFECSKL